MADLNTFLHNLYHNPETGYINAHRLYKKAKSVNASITQKQVKEWYDLQKDIQPFQNKKSALPSFKIASENPHSWQADLTFHKYPKDTGTSSKSTKYPNSSKQTILLTCVNINSRMAYAAILNSKKQLSVLHGMKVFINKFKPQIITTDNGSEFMNKSIQHLFKLKKVRHFNNEPEDHQTMGKIERFNRTLKQRLMRIGDKELDNELLRKIIFGYNNTPHRGIDDATPIEMNRRVDKKAVEHNREVAKQLDDNFQIGQSVVYRLPKATFEKEKQIWSSTVYEIVDVDGFKYQLRSKNNHVLYKGHNDIKVVKSKPTDAAESKKDNIYEVEKILEHKTNKNGTYRYLVKWKGYEHPTWEPQANLRLINKSEMSTIEKEYWNSSYELRRIYKLFN